MLKSTASNILQDELDFYSQETRCGKLSVHYHGDVASIWNVEIFPPFRGKKLGKQMMKEVVEYICNHWTTIETIFLNVFTTNIPAIKAYQSTGFKVVGESHFSGRDRIFRMELSAQEIREKLAPDCFWTINGNRMVRLDGQIFSDFLSYEMMYKGMRKTSAQIYLENLGFSEDDAEEYLSGLNPKEN